MEPKCENFWIPLCTVYGSVGAVWVACVVIYALNLVLMCMRSEMAMDFKFTKWNRCRVSGREQ